MTEYDAVIVGAGPAGTSCAITLAQGGAKILICDKAAFPRQKICGDCIHPGVWPLLAHLGAAEEVRRAMAEQIDSVSVSNVEGSTFTASVPRAHSGPFFAMRRDTFDQILLSRARRAGVHVREETQVREIHRNEPWRVTIGEDVVRCRYLVGADGRNSTIARMFGTPTIRSKADSRRVGVQWLTHRQSGLGSGVHLFLFRDGYAGVVNLDNTRANIAIVTTPTLAREAGRQFTAFLERSLLSNSAAMSRLDFPAPISRVSSAFPIVPIHRRSMHPYAFLIGDARQTFEPFTGQGVYSAMLNGIDQARKLLLMGRKNSPSNHARVSRISSFILTRPVLAGHCVDLGTSFPPIVSYAMNSIFR